MEDRVPKGLIKGVSSRSKQPCLKAMRNKLKLSLNMANLSSTALALSNFAISIDVRKVLTIWKSQFTLGRLERLLFSLVMDHIFMRGYTEAFGNDKRLARYHGSSTVSKIQLRRKSCISRRRSSGTWLDSPKCGS